MPGVSLVQSGARGGVTSVFVRGGNSNFNKVLDRRHSGQRHRRRRRPVAVLGDRRRSRSKRSAIRTASSSAATRSPASISVISRRGRTPVPQATLSIDGGNLGTNRESAAIGGTVRRFDYFSEFVASRHRQRRAEQQVSRQDVCRTFRRRGRPQHRCQRHRSAGSIAASNRRTAIDLYGTPDDPFQAYTDEAVRPHVSEQITDKWQTTMRVGSFDQRAHFENPTLSGTNIGGIGFGDVMTITGANGYSVTGRGVLDFGPFSSDSRSARQGFYAQTSYQVHPRPEHRRRRQLRTRAGVPWHEHRRRSDDDPEQSRGVGGRPRHRRRIASA